MKKFLDEAADIMRERHGLVTPIDIFDKVEEVDEEQLDMMSDMNTTLVMRDNFKESRGLLRDEIIRALEQESLTGEGQVSTRTFNITEEDMDEFMMALEQDDVIETEAVELEDNINED